ncbi:diacylglycerol/lipid kinase family protein [Pseudidiomarina insulisalsae]|nr:diacylglycerol kinase family protein [Pseudidiomarina insulisalsae]
MQTKSVALYVSTLAEDFAQRRDAYHAFFQQQSVAALTVIESTSERHLDEARLASWADALQADTEAELVVIGGDGSISIAAQVCVTRKIAITAVPSGTGNDFARALGISDWRWRLQHPQGMRMLCRSVGTVSGRYFINHAGCGISVAMQRLQSKRSRRYLARYSYLWALLRYLLVRPAKRCRIIDDKGQHWEFQVAAVNSDIGGGIKVYPKAQLDTEVLGILQVPRISRFRQLGALFWMLRKQPQRSRKLAFHEAPSFTLGDSQNLIELDGDTTGHYGPAEVTVVPQGLRVYCPEN